MLLWAISAGGAPMMHYFPLVYSPLCLYSSAICAFPSPSSYLSTGNYAFTTYSLYSSPNLTSVVISFCRTLLFSPRLKGILVPALAKCQLKWNCWVSLCNITTHMCPEVAVVVNWREIKKLSLCQELMTVQILCLRYTTKEFTDCRYL